MKAQANGPKDPRERKVEDPTFNTQPDLTPRREGGDDALAENSDALEASAPNDSRADEKVIVNEQREHKTVNGPSQTAANTNGSDEEIIN